MQTLFKKLLLFLLALSLVGCSGIVSDNQNDKQDVTEGIQLSSLPEFDGKTPFVELNNNIPSFDEKEKGSKEVFEVYPELDRLGRCQRVYANLHVSNMPTEDRGSIGMIKPTGWVTSKYDFVDGKYLYNRCHLIGFQLAGENANDRNLITGTRYLNIDGMLPFENKVASYLKESGNHVLYRVTPVFQGDELVARGVQIEAYSVEDNGAGIHFNVYCYNNQPGVIIDYMTGANHLDENKSQKESQEELQTYVINMKSKKFHTADCPNADKITDENKRIENIMKEELIAEGYEAAKCCIDK